MTTSPKPLKMKLDVKWQALTNGILKFNTDSASSRNPGKARISGVLKDENGNVLFLFLFAVGIMDANIAKINALCKDLQMFVTFKWGSQKLILENDSQNTIKWGLNPTIAPWKLRSLIIQILYLKSKIECYEIIKIPKSANEIVDSLVKSKVRKGTDFIQVMVEADND